MAPTTSPPVLPQPLWATSADGQGPDTRPTELDELSTHMRHCTAAHSRLAAVQSGLVQARSFVLGHLVSSLAVFLALLTTGWLLLAP